jgi:hypothetical protein
MLADDAFARLASADAFGVVTLSADTLFGLPAEIGLRVVERAVIWAGGGRVRHRLSRLENTFDALCAAAPGHAATLDGAVLTKTDDAVRIFREAGRLRLAPMPIPRETPLVWDGRFTISCAEPLPERPRVMMAGAKTTRAEVEELAGPVAAPMRALAAAPAIRDAGGRLLTIGAIAASHLGVDVSLTFNTNPRRTGQNPGNQDAN